MTVDKLTLSPQCAAILAELRGGARTTLELMTATGVLGMGPRIHELRAALEPARLAIDTQLVEVQNRHGQRCRVARYSLRRIARPKPERKAKVAADAGRVDLLGGMA